MNSIAGRRVTGSDGAVYSSTKFAVHALSEALRRDLHPEGIRVIVVSPGWVDTNLENGEIRDTPQKRQEEIGLAPEDIGRQVARAPAEPRNVRLHEIAVGSTEEN